MRVHACARRLGVNHYRTVVEEVAAAARRGNPRVLIVAQLSFRHTPTARMVDAIEPIQNFIDGIYLAYPSRAAGECDYCSPEAVAALLEALEPQRAPPATEPR